MERGAGAHVTRDPLGEGLQEGRHMTDPARHDGVDGPTQTASSAKAWSPERHI